MAATPFRLTISVAAGDIDEQRHVNNTVYLRWVQEAALAHWQVIASPESQQSIDWVVLRHEIDYKAPAVAGDSLDVSTWVGKATRLTFERFTEIRRSRDNTVLAAARTLWCPVDTETRRPRRVPDEVRTQFSL